MSAVPSPSDKEIARRFDAFFAQARKDARSVVLIVDDHLPRYDQNAGSLGMFHYAKLFRELGYAVVFMPHDRQADERYAAPLRQLGIEVCSYPLDLARWLSRYGGSIAAAWLSRPNIAMHYFGPLRALSRAVILFCGYDLHFLRMKRQAAVEGSTDPDGLIGKVEAVERMLVKGADAALVYSGVERDIIAREFGARDNVHVIPAYIYDVTLPQPSEPAFSDRTDILFVGSFQHTPNADGVLWFVREIWPLIRVSVPAARFAVIGPNPELLSLPASPGVELRGHVPDLEPHFARAKLSVAPLRYGAGVKGKIVASLASGLPVVTTEIGAEGMGLTDGRDVLLANDPAEFARQIVLLWFNARRWAELSAAGRAFVAQNYSRERAASILTGILAKHGVSPTLAAHEPERR